MQLCVPLPAGRSVARCAVGATLKPYGYAHLNDQDSIDQRRDALNWVTSCDLKSVGRETSSPRIPMCRREVGAGVFPMLVGFIHGLWMVVRFVYV